MSTNHDKFQTNESGLFTLVTRLFVKGNQGYGAFTFVSSRVPAVGEMVDYSDTPEGSLTGKVIAVRHVAQFQKLFPVLSEENRMGQAALMTPCSPFRQEWQVDIEVASSDHPVLQAAGTMDY